MKSQHFNIKLIGVLFFAVMIFAQFNEAQGQNYLKTPVALDGYVKSSYINQIYNNQLSLEEISNSSTTSRFWTVYSDRKENKLYGNAGGFPNKDHLDFMEMVVVKDVKTSGGKSWLHVYSKHYKEKEKVAESHKERGWIRADKIILSNYSLLNKKSIPRKRMILYSLDLEDKNIEKEFYPYYKSPSAQSKKSGKAKRFHIYYVLKEEASWVLLSKTDRLDGSNQMSNVLGWIPKKYTTGWDHRICFEPSYGQRAEDAYKDKKLPVFQDKKNLNSFIQTEVTSNKYFFKKWQITDTRLDPYTMRMPILENVDENRKKVVTISNINDTKGVDIANIIKKIVELKNKQEKVNVLFVIDGTQSMAPYFPKIRESITKIIGNNENRMSNTTLQFGLAIYRDYADGDKKFEIEPLTSDHNKVVNKLRLVDPQSKDSDLPEAQYQGLVKGLQQAGFDKQNSNVVVLIGDAGNHTNDPEGFNSENVIDELYKYRASLIAFQVINGNDASYDKFYYDAFGYLTQSAQKYVTNKNEVKINQTSIKNTYRLEYPDYDDKKKVLYMFGRYTYASGRRPMEPSILEKNIIESTDAYLEKVDEVLELLEGIRDGAGGAISEEVSEAMITFLRSREDFTESELQALKNIGEFTMKGYVSKQYYNQDVNCFKPVVFLSRGEKQQIDQVLKSLTYGNKPITERKKELQGALLEQCKRMLGDVSDANILDKTMDDIWQIILAIPFTGDPYIKNKKLREIKSLSDERFQAFYSDFEEAARDFARNDYRDSRFELADQYYYWIPLEDIPGNQ